MKLEKIFTVNGRRCQSVKYILKKQKPSTLYSNKNNNIFLNNLNL